MAKFLVLMMGPEQQTVPEALKTINNIISNSLENTKNGNSSINRRIIMVINMIEQMVV